MEAVVDVDEHQKITKYKGNDGSLQLKTKRSSPFIAWSKEENEKLLNFLAEKSKQAKEPLLLKPLCREFAEKNGSSRTMQAVNSYILRHILPNISRLNEFDMETRMKMIFALSAPIDEGVLKKLRKEAIVEVDECQRITKYEANDGSLQLETERSPPYIVWSKEEDDNLLNFIVDKSKETNVPLTANNLSREFAEKDGVSRTKRAVEHYLYNHILPNISKMNNFDVETRMRMSFTLGIPVDEGFLNKLRRKAAVDVDEHQRITKYEANDGSLQLERKKLPPFTTWSKEENKKLLSFLTEKSKQTKKPLNIRPLCREFAEKNEICRTMQAAKSYILRHILPNISTLNDFDIETRMRMAFALSAPVDQDFLNKLREKAFVEIDQTRRITKYKAKDGVLELTRDRRISTRTKEKRASKKSISGFSKVVETDEESEDVGEKDEDGNEDISKPNTRSRRLSKQQYPDVDLSSDFDDVSLDSTEIMTDSKVEKETEKLVPNSSDSSSKTPLIKTQKRKIIENSSDATSSSTKTRKYGRDADTQNVIETEKIASLAMQNDNRKTVYDSSEKPPRPIELSIKQESPSHKKVKLEVEEYKPDRSFLCGTAMQNFFGTEGNRIDDVEQATGNTEELASGKEFMKLLRGLVDTLDSPTLLEFHAKIDKSIKELGDGDHKIPTNEIAMTLNNELNILNKKATMEPLTGESTSLRDFLLILQSTLFTFHSSSLSNFKLKLKETIKKLDGHDKVILLDCIRTVLETLLPLVVS